MSLLRLATVGCAALLAQEELDGNFGSVFWAVSQWTKLSIFSLFDACETFILLAFLLLPATSVLFPLLLAFLAF